MSFTDKVVIVTGASSGIGAATAIAFAKEGAKVAIVGRNEEKLAATAAACGDNAPLVLRIDISDESQAATAVQRTVNEFGKLDILVNNAGMAREASLLEGNLLQVFDEVMNTNLRAVFHLTSLATPHLIKSKGNVVNVSSIGGLMKPLIPSFITYSVSKAALNHFGVSAASELAPHGVRVNTVSPGPVRTDMIDNSGLSGEWDSYKPITALERISDPQDIADVILFLASEKAKGITGSNYISDNGVLLK